MAMAPMEYDNLKYDDINIICSNLTWAASEAGKYYAATSFDSQGKTVLAINIKSWSSFSAQMDIQPYINGSGGVSLMSNTTSWGSTSPSMTLRIFYK